MASPSRGGTGAAGHPAAAFHDGPEEVHPEALGGAGGRYLAGNTIGGPAGRLLPSFVTDLAGWRWGLAAAALAAALLTVAFWPCCSRCPRPFSAHAHL
ncbi:hypothetical protein ABGB18_46930 [Nonomuraea sp. B12E4]|uniref:hypothetical protein n=1 Tax=Nonomuraea sp. B12E4 TaxID=3153564 RepID=UPI00325EA029